MGCEGLRLLLELTVGDARVFGFTFGVAIGEEDVGGFVGLLGGSVFEEIDKVSNVGI